MISGNEQYSGKILFYKEKLKHDQNKVNDKK